MKKKVKEEIRPRICKDFTYYLDEDIKRIMSKSEIEKFEGWIYGQTVGVVRGKVAYYSWDVERFLRLIRKGVPTFFD